MRLDAAHVDIEAMLDQERPRLVRLCSRLVGRIEPAEDLAQETLIEAWRHLHKLHDPSGYQPWLSAIARNVCRRWLHFQYGNNSLTLSADDGGNLYALPDDNEPSDPYDFELELERDELADLLDRALKLLPPDTRAVLIKRYIDASPHAEIAAAMGMTEGAVKVKVHRGKLALRRVLTTDLRMDAATFGLIDLAQGPIQVTEIWCPVCGNHRLEAHFHPDGDAAALRCPHCCDDRQVFIYCSLPLRMLRDPFALKSELAQQSQVIASFFRTAGIGEQQYCEKCGRPLAAVRPELRRNLVTYADVCQFSRTCTFCGNGAAISWRMLAQSRPEVCQFWQRHPRMYTLPPRSIETGGVEAVVTGFRSIDGHAGIDIITRRQGLQVIGVHPTIGG